MSSTLANFGEITGLIQVNAFKLNLRATGAEEKQSGIKYKADSYSNI